MNSNAFDFDNQVFANNLKSQIDRLNIKNNDLADYLGLSKSAISNYLAGVSVPKYGVLKKMAYALHVTTDFLLRTPDPHLQEGQVGQEGEKVPLLAPRLDYPSLPLIMDNCHGHFVFPIPVYRDLNCFAFKIVDNSLKNSGITDSSIVFFSPQEMPKDGELAVVAIQNKVYARRVTMTKDKIILETDETKETFTISGKNKDDISVLGKIVLATFVPNNEA